MSTHLVFRLIPARPRFAQDMSEEERAIMARHAEHWRPQIEAGRMVAFGPVLDDSGGWGLGVLEADSEEDAIALSRMDPAVMSGLGHYEMGRMLGGFVRPGASAGPSAEGGVQGL